MLVNFTFIGLMAPVFTIFNNDFSVNTDRVPAYANYLLESGINGILVAATTGEGTSLSVQERKNLTESWVSTTKNTGQHLMIQVGGAPFPDVIELARHADKFGVDSILAMPELYFKPKKPQDLISYLKFISAAAPNTPLFYYHNPGHTGVTISFKIPISRFALVDMAEFLEQASGQIPNLKGIKYTSNDLAGGYAALRSANGKYTVFIGGDYLIEPAFAAGFESAIAGSMNVFPKYSIGMVEAIKQSKLDIAMELQQNLTRIINIISKYGSKVSVMKLAMNLFTPINVGLARPPLQNPSPSKIQELKTFLEPYV